MVKIVIFRDRNIRRLGGHGQVKAVEAKLEEPFFVGIALAKKESLARPTFQAVSPSIALLLLQNTDTTKIHRYRLLVFHNRG